MRAHELLRKLGADSHNANETVSVIARVHVYVFGFNDFDAISINFSHHVMCVSFRAMICLGLIRYGTVGGFFGTHITTTRNSRKRGTENRRNTSMDGVGSSETYFAHVKPQSSESKHKTKILNRKNYCCTLLCNHNPQDQKNPLNNHFLGRKVAG